MQPNIESSKDETVERKTVENKDEPSLLQVDDLKDVDDNQSTQNEHKDMDTDDIALGKENGNEEKIESETDSEDENLSKNDLKLCLCLNGNNLQIFESDHYAERALSDEEILENVNVLKIPMFRRVFLID